MAAEDIGNLFNTKIPGYEDAADIQAALRLFLYGSTSYDPANSDTSQLPSPSLAKHLQLMKDRIQAQEDLGIGSGIGSSSPTSPADGYVWMDSDADLAGVTQYSTVVYSNTAPTEDLVDGVIWIDKDASPARGYVYDSSTSDWVSITEIPGIFDAAGDIIYGAGQDDIAKLSIGTSGQILKVVSGIPAWSDQKAWVLKGSGSLSGTGFSVSSISGEKIYLVLKNWSHDNAISPSMITVRFNNDSSSNYVNTDGLTSASSLHSPVFLDNVSNNMTIAIDLANTSSGLKPVSTIADTSAGQYFGYYKNTAAISSVQVSISPSGNFDSGTYEVWSYE